MSQSITVVDKAEWKTRIAAAVGMSDAAELRSIADALRGTPAPWAGPLRLEALNHAASIDRGRRPIGQSSWWYPYGLPAPDGRPLWQYRVSDHTLARIEKDLRQAVPFQIDKSHNPALFVLWAAERFRRHWDGGWQRWQAVAEPLGLPWRSQADTARLRVLTDSGLQHWQLTAFRTGLGRARVETLIRQGGFPLAAIGMDGGGAVRRWLERLVAHGAGQAASDVAALARLGQVLMADLPQRWQSSFFAELGAELADAVLALRRLAEGHAQPGVPLSAWLEQARPGWRETLPLGIGDAAGQRLIDSLLSVAPQRVRGDADAIRALRRQGDSWQPVVQLGLDGVWPDPDRLIGQGWSRARLRASGPAARWLPGDLAVAEAVDDEWDLTPTRAESVMPLPLDVALTCQLAVGGSPVGRTIAILPAVRAAVLVCAGTDDGDPDSSTHLPDALRIVGSGSGQYRPAVLWLLLPSGYRPGPATAAGEGPNGRNWWRIDTTCRVEAPDGDVFLVRPGQTQERRDAIDVVASNVNGLSEVEDLPLWPQRPTIFVKDGGHSRNPQPGALWWRSPGQRWQPLDSALPLGRVDVAWRQDGLLRALASGVVLPDEAGASAREGLVTLRGLQGARVENATLMENGSWRLSGEARDRSRARVTWRGVTLCVHVPQREAIIDWQGRVQSSGSKLFLGELDLWVARCNGPIQLLAHVEDRDGRPLPGSAASWSFDSDLPLSAIAGDIAALLQPETPGCRVALNFNNGIDQIWYVHEYRRQLERRGDSLVVTEPIPIDDVVLSGRPLHEPRREDSIAPCSLQDCLNHRPIALPRFEGNWIVYLKHDGRVLSQPQLITAGLPVQGSGLAATMAITDRNQRFIALEALAEQAEVEPSGMIAQALVELAASLDGLAPATFDVFTVMARRPLLAARMAFIAPESRQAAVLGVAEGLPFLWALIGRDTWEKAAQIHFEALYGGLSGFMPEAEALKHAAADIARIRRLLVQAEPALAHALHFNSDDRPIMEVANAFLNRAHDRVMPRRSHFRRRLAPFLPAWTVSEDFWGALDAPCAAALHAAGRTLLEPADLRIVRQIARRHPVWFAEGFAAFSRSM